jgi:hypothetical protein
MLAHPINLLHALIALLSRGMRHKPYKDHAPYRPPFNNTILVLIHNTLVAFLFDSLFGLAPTTPLITLLYAAMKLIVGKEAPA